jgi:hypothetical protein
VIKHSKWVIQNQDFSTVVTFISVYRSDFLSRVKQNPSSHLVEEMFRHMLDKGLARTPSCREIHTGLWDNKEMVATFDVSTSVAEDSGPLGCAAVSLC